MGEIHVEQEFQVNTPVYSHTHTHMVQYIGTFSVEMGPSWKKDMGKTVKQQLSRINTKVRLP